MTATVDAASVSVETLIFDRLADADLPGPTANLVVAALLGDIDLAAALNMDGYQRPAAQPDAAVGDALAGTFLQSVTVEGFRGIGAETTLSLLPGPGLTLVVGRNGSGKSSFAEATLFPARERRELGRVRWLLPS